MTKQLTKRQEALVQNTLQNAVVAVRTIPNAALAEFLPMLEEAKKLLIRDLKAFELLEDGAKRYTAHKYRSALVQLDAAMKEIASLGPAMATTLTVYGGQAGLAGLNAMEMQLAAMDTLFTGAMVPISIDRAAVLSKGDKLLLKRYPTSAARYAGNIGAEVRRKLAVGVLRQQSIGEVTNELFKEIPKVFKTAKFNAHRLIRTEVMYSYNSLHHEGLIDAHDEDSDVKMRWDASYDFRRCPACADLDGRVVEVAGTFTANWTTKTGLKKSSTSQHPPLHPLCRCVLVPWMDDFPDVDWNVDPPDFGEPSPEASMIFGRGVRPKPLPG